MGLYFHNKTIYPLQIVLAYFDPQCESDGINKWRKTGWFLIDPGKTNLVWNGSAKNKKFLYYSEDRNNLGYIWSGNIFTHIPYRRFNRCWDITSTEPGRRLGLKVFTATTNNYTLNFILE
ncbi:DUF1036 domain-containing protein [Bacillus mycoides]|uniref:DUF1036 domain-containing protein n=1 Tax=Bacillus mycoides TaxID=1405 RepID=A0AAP8GSW1_BACMY|nr:DUF1036 domain-containing protein [Bacillus mycoides]PJN50709.1 hypothetical protein BAWEI_61620 [Bacillus mycoides]PJN64526.1 hypothetical protein BACWE_50920 [Bacillus mycoides]